MNEEPMITTPAQQPNQDQQPKLKKSKGNMLPWLLAILLAVASAGGVYMWQKKEVKDLKNKSNSQAAEIDGLKIAAADHAADKSEDVEGDDGAASTNIENLKAAVQSGNFAALEDYLASTVHIIIAASEGLGDRTPAQAMEDLKYLNTGTDPWNFALSAETLNEWRAGDYGSYVPISAVVGRSANDLVVSFQFNSDGKISVIFMAANADLM